VPLPELKVTVFSDYICPFCYIGFHRLQRLRDTYDLKVNWRFIEIHPEVSARGQAIDTLDYSSAQWQIMLDNMQRIAREENIPLSKISFITSSHDALLLSEAAKQCGARIFYSLHDKLFHAYFVDGKNIGDRAVLRGLAKSCGIDDSIVDQAWSDPAYKQRLVNNYSEARKHNIQSVPGFLFGNRKLTGVVNESLFREAAAELNSNDNNQL
jgi:predicted DsbA family dithiol-disulfide isomerase